MIKLDWPKVKKAFGTFSYIHSCLSRQCIVLAIQKDVQEPVDNRIKNGKNIKIIWGDYMVEIRY